MHFYFDKVKQKDMVGFFASDKKLCNLIEFDYNSIPPQVFVALEQAYLLGIEEGGLNVKPAEAIKLSKNNRVAVQEASLVGCYHCLSIYAADMVEDFVDDEQTAICPRCYVDAVVPGPVTKEELRLANHKWFGGRYE